MYLTAVATKTKPIGNYDNCQFTTIVNSASTAVPIGLPLKMAKFCHTSNRLLVGCQCHRALWRLYFNSSAVSQLLVIGWSTIRVPGLWEVSLQKDKSSILLEWNGKALNGKRTRHINIRYFFITDWVNMKEISID